MNPAPTSARRVRIIPVLDVMGGDVVRAVGGRRERYQVTPSKLTTSTQPLEVAETLLQASGGNELYVADIDALRGHRPQLGWVRDLTTRGVTIVVDAGIRRASDAKLVSDAGAQVIVGTETISGTSEMMSLVDLYGSPRVILSVDLRNGRVVGDEAVWGFDPEPDAVVARGLLAGLQRFILLELARVGTGIGPGTVELCRQLRGLYPDVELIAGGGVRNWDDVDRLGEAGADGVLVASALHDGVMRYPRSR